MHKSHDQHCPNQLKTKLGREKNGHYVTRRRDLIIKTIMVKREFIFDEEKFSSQT